MKTKLLLFLALLGGAYGQMPAKDSPLMFVKSDVALHTMTIDEAILQSPFFKSEAADVVKAMKLLLHYSDHNEAITTDLVFRNEAATLQLMADRAAQREKDIAWARTVLAKWEARAK